MRIFIILTLTLAGIQLAAAADRTDKIFIQDNPNGNQTVKDETGGAKNQMAAFFAVLQPETQTLDQLEDEVLDYYGAMPFYDFLRSNPRYDAILRAQKQRFEDEQNASKARKP